MTMPHDAAPLLRLCAVSKHFGGVEALTDFNLTLHRGEVLALVGDNAAGKSTVARLVAGVYQPDAGTLELDCEPVVIPTAKTAITLGVATVFQEFALIEKLDVTTNIFLGRELIRHGLLDREQMDQLARKYLGRLRTRIHDLNQPLGQLSAGQRQCVAIARTLVSEPRIVVLDEPTASLSVSQTAEVLSYIEDLRGMGLGVILISHNLNDVRAVADRVEVLRHGRNNGSFSTDSATYEEILAAVTGATHVR